MTGAKSLTIVDFLLNMIPANMVGAVAAGDLLPVLIISVLFSFTLCHIGEASARLALLIDVVMYVAPLAALAATAFTIGKFGLAAREPREAGGLRLADLDPVRPIGSG